MAADLPAEDDPTGIFEFAMGCNGYEHYGSFAACAEVAKKRERNSVQTLRNELFFVARASRHCGDDNYVQTYREILPLLRQFMAVK